jgi:hypothetical protein
MPNFQASLYDTVTQDISITLDQSCEILTIVDKSNYSASDEDGFELADFSTWRQLEITFPNGSTYDFDSTGTISGAGVWNAPNGGSDTINYSLVEANGDGVYCATLFVVPDYDNAVAYTHTASSPKAVYYLGKLYRTVASTTGNLPTDTAYWEEIQREDLSSKFKTTAKFALTCRSLTACYEGLVHEANCVIAEDLCNDLCTNDKLLDGVKVRMLLDGISYSARNSEWDRAQVLTDAAKSICNC